jgi:hypothetical protein
MQQGHACPLIRVPEPTSTQAAPPEQHRFATVILTPVEPRERAMPNDPNTPDPPIVPTPSVPMVPSAAVVRAMRATAAAPRPGHPRVELQTGPYLASPIEIGVGIVLLVIALIAFSIANPQF